MVTTTSTTYSSTDSSTSGNYYNTTWSSTSSTVACGTNTSTTADWHIWSDGSHDRSSEEVKVDEKKQKAEEKAVKLLESLIGDEVEVYKKTGRVFVKGRKGAYIVRKDRTVQKIEKNKIVDLCVHIESKHKCPSTDHVVALKMLLENDEDYILKLANRVGTESLPEELPLAACM